MDECIGFLEKEKRNKLSLMKLKNKFFVVKKKYKK